MTGSTRTRSREYALVLALIAIGAALSWWATSASWAVGEQELLGDASGQYAEAVAQRSLTAAALAPAAAAMPIVVLAGLAGVIGSRRWLRRVIGGVICIAGGVLIWSGTSTAITLDVGDPVPAPDVGVIVSVAIGYPVLAAVAGVVVTASGLLVVTRGARWPSLGANYERATDRPRDAWEALDAGIDPTVDSPADGTGGGMAGRS